jgi:hypothetical protein
MAFDVAWTRRTQLAAPRRRAMALRPEVRWRDVVRRSGCFVIVLCPFQPMENMPRSAYAAFLVRAAFRAAARRPAAPFVATAFRAAALRAAEPRRRAACRA